MSVRHRTKESEEGRAGLSKDERARAPRPCRCSLSLSLSPNPLTARSAPTRSPRASISRSLSRSRDSGSTCLSEREGGVRERRRAARRRTARSKHSRLARARVRSHALTELPPNMGARLPVRMHWRGCVWCVGVVARPCVGMEKCVSRRARVRAGGAAVFGSLSPVLVNPAPGGGVNACPAARGRPPPAHIRPSMTSSSPFEEDDLIPWPPPPPPRTASARAAPPVPWRLPARTARPPPSPPRALPTARRAVGGGPGAAAPLWGGGLAEQESLEDLLAHLGLGKAGGGLVRKMRRGDVKRRGGG